MGVQEAEKRGVLVEVKKVMDMEEPDIDIELEGACVMPGIEEDMDMDMSMSMCMGIVVVAIEVELVISGMSILAPR